MNDFWLNEGFTVYAERRILEALEGKEALALHAALGRKHLEIDSGAPHRKRSQADAPPERAERSAYR